MPVLGITGGIATGKSSFTRAFLRQQPAELFDADQQAHQLLAEDCSVQDDVRKAFGSEAYAGGVVDRKWLREAVFSDERKRRELEGILHPILRRRWMAMAAASAQASGWLVVDLPLLYETAAEASFDRVVVVACSPAIQRERLETIRGLSGLISERMIAAQIDLNTKMKRADHLIWNDSNESLLDEQAILLTSWLRQRYG